MEAILDLKQQNPTPWLPPQPSFDATTISSSTQIWEILVRMDSSRGQGRRRGRRLPVHIRQPNKDEDMTQSLDSEDKLQAMGLGSSHVGVDNSFGFGESSSSQLFMPPLPELDPEELWFHKSSVVRSVLASFKENYNFPWMKWSEVPGHIRDKWFQTFKTYFRWRPELETRVWEEYDRTMQHYFKYEVNKEFDRMSAAMSIDMQKQLHECSPSPAFKARSKRNRDDEVIGSKKVGGLVDPSHHQGFIPSTEHLAREKKDKQHVLADENAIKTMAIGGHKKGQVHGLKETAPICFERSSSSRSTPSVSSTHPNPGPATIFYEIRMQMERLNETCTKMRDQNVVIRQGLERLEKWKQDESARMAEEEQRRAEIIHRSEELWQWYLCMSQTQHPSGSIRPPFLGGPRDPPDGGGTTGSFPVIS